MVADAGNFFQFLHIRFQHPGQAAEMVQQSVGDGIGVLLGNGVEQQQLQRLDIRKIVQAFLQEAGLQPFPVAFVDGCVCHKRHLLKFVLAIFVDSR